jgi:hypothetical protein
MAQTTCSRCSAQYNSERELSDHLATAHRKFCPEQSSSEPANAPLELPAAIANDMLTRVLTEDQEHVSRAFNGTSI